jgi:hypothetical protein
MMSVVGRRFIDVDQIAGAGAEVVFQEIADLR